MRSGTMKEKLKVKGTIYVDRSRKGKTKAGTPKLREIFRAEVSYGGKRYRFRSSDYEACIAFWKCWPIVTLQWNPTLPEIDLPCEKP